MRWMAAWAAIIALQVPVTLDPDNVDATALLMAADRGLAPAAPEPSAATFSSLPAEQPNSFASGRYEVRHRVPGQDTRRLLCQHQLDLLATLSDTWRAQGEARWAETLSRYPFDDEAQARS